MKFFQLKSGIKLHYRILGNDTSDDLNNKPLLMLFHGFGSGIYTWESIEQEFSKEFILLSWEHRGHGDSDKPIGSTYEETLKLYTLEQVCKDANELVHSLFPELKNKYFIIGHSMGGMIAQVYMLMYQEEIAGAILESTSCRNDGDSLNKILNDLKSGAVEFGRDAVSMNVTLGTSYKYRKLHPEIIERSIQYKLKLPKDVYIAFLENMVTGFNVVDKLKHIKIPVLILHGDKDGLVPIMRGEELHKMIPTSKFITITKGSHSINAECTDAIFIELKKFIESQ